MHYYFLNVLVLWNEDGSCGISHPLSNGDPAQCDPESSWGPCCSAYGYCGISDDHCNCDGCVDFRDTSKSI